MNFINIFDSITILSVVKVMIIMLLVVYDVFALLMMKQVAAMTRAIAMRDDYVIRILGLLNFGFATLVLIMAIFIL